MISTSVSRLSKLKISYIFLAMFLAGVLSTGYFYVSSYEFSVRTGENKETFLGIVSAFVSTYSEQRRAENNIHMPGPASFRALSFKLFDKNVSSHKKGGVHIEMVGVPGRAIKTKPSNEHVAKIINQMILEENPQTWSGYMGGFGKEFLRTIKPVRADKQSCAECHNGLQKSVATWALGDVMGAYIIDAPASGFFERLRWETGVLGLGAFLFIWSSVTFFTHQQARLMTIKAEVLRGSERSTMLSAAKKQAENEASKLSNQVRKAYEDLRQALTKERELNALQRQFISMASHEFRTPLAIIDGTAQRLERRAGMSGADEVAKRAQKIRSAVERMTRVMESTLSEATLEVGKLTIKIEPCDIARILLDACRRQMEISQNHKISCTIYELPGTIQADPGSVEQIISNLLSNAVKYAPDAPAIDVEACLQDDEVVFSVRDYGLGIDEEDLPRMFERFFRARTATAIAGTGIGLNLIKILIEMHDGSIAISSETGKGSTFTVRLPVNGPEEIATNGCQAA